MLHVFRVMLHMFRVMFRLELSTSGSADAEQFSDSFQAHAQNHQFAKNVYLRQGGRYAIYADAGRYLRERLAVWLSGTPRST